MPISRLVRLNRQILVMLAQLALLTGALVAAALTSREQDWQPAALVWLLVGFAVLSERLTVDGRGMRISGSFIAIVVAMVTLGPAPAVLVGISGIAFDAFRTNLVAWKLLVNVTAYAVFPVIAALAFRALEPALDADAELARASAVVALFMSANVLNFVLIAVPGSVVERRSIAEGFRRVLLPLLPSQLAAGVLTAIVCMIFEQAGLPALAMAGVVALVFQHLLRTTMLSVERANELEVRTRELAGLQMGLITTVLRTLSMRDKMTARHSAAVARYARQVAAELNLDEQSRETIHTAALLHDIGKFIFPDSILLSNARLTEEEFEIVKRHPEQGARLVGRIEGYEQVAEIIHAHHERMDGGGYPRRLPAESIPIGSRIIAVCDTYDVMTARDSYRQPVSVCEALAELRRVAGTQLDPAVVDVFIRLIEQRGVAFRHSDDADFEAELNLERRVAEYATPRRALAV